MIKLAPWRRMLNSLGELTMLGGAVWLVWRRFTIEGCPLRESGWFTPYALVIYGLAASLIALHCFGSKGHLANWLRGPIGAILWGVSLAGIATALYMLQSNVQGLYILLVLIPAVLYLAFGVRARSGDERKRAVKAPKAPAADADQGGQDG